MRFALLVVGAMSACSAFKADPSGNGEPSDDGGTAPAEAAAAPSDAGTTDAAADAPLVPFCERRPHKLCVSFDSAPITNQWSAKSENPPATTVDFEPTLGATSPGCLVATAAPVTAPYGSEGLLQRLGDSGFIGRTFALHLAVRPEELPDVHDTPIATVLWGNAIFYLTLSNVGVGVFEGLYGVCGSVHLCGSTHFGTRPAPLGRWTEIEMLLVPSDAGPPRLVVRSGGREDVNLTMRPEFSTTTYPNGMLLSVGITVNRTADKNRKLYIDDVSFDLER